MWRHGMVPKGQRHHLRSSPADVVQYSALKLIDCSFFFETVNLWKNVEVWVTLKTH